MNAHLVASLGTAWLILLANGAYWICRQRLSLANAHFVTANVIATLAFLTLGMGISALVTTAVGVWCAGAWWYSTAEVHQPKPPSPRPLPDDPSIIFARPYADRDACWGCGCDPELTDEEKGELRQRKGEVVPACRWCAELVVLAGAGEIAEERSKVR